MLLFPYSFFKKDILFLSKNLPVIWFFCFCQNSTNILSLTPDPAIDHLQNGTILIYDWELNKKRSDKATPIELFLIFNHPDIITDKGFWGYPLYQHEFMYNKMTDKSYHINLHGAFFIHPKKDDKPLPFGDPNSLHFIYKKDYFQNGLVCQPFIPDVLNLDKVQVLFPFIIEQAKVDFFGSRSKKHLRIFSHTDLKDVFKKYPPLSDNEHDYLCLCIPDKVKEELKNTEQCKCLLSNTTNIINDAIKHVDNQYESLNSVKFDKIKVLQPKKDKQKERRPMSKNLQSSKSKKRKKQKK